MEIEAKAKHRILAYIIDMVIVFVISALLMLFPLISLIDALNGTSNTDIVFLVISTFLYGGISVIFIVFYYVIVPLFTKGQTIGKKLLRIRIVKVDGSNVDFLTLFSRELIGKIFIDFATFGFTLIPRCYNIIVRSNHRTFHDVISSTKVIDVN